MRAKRLHRPFNPQRHAIQRAEEAIEALAAGAHESGIERRHYVRMVLLSGYAPTVSLMLQDSGVATKLSYLECYAAATIIITSGSLVEAALAFTRVPRTFPVIRIALLTRALHQPWLQVFTNQWYQEKFRNAYPDMLPLEVETLKTYLGGPVNFDYFIGLNQREFVPMIVGGTTVAKGS